MKLFSSLILAFSLFFFSNLSACPYSAMTKIDQKLENPSQFTKEDLAKIINLRKLGEAELKLGNVDKSEEILNSALALFN
tara:strand:- start:270 stop:509 length:240 start_codon:yes stop_codon:yes gene_type:complete